MKLIKVNKSPKFRTWRFDYDSRLPPGIEPLFEWMKTNLSGTIYWQKTLFRDPKTGRTGYCNNIRNFKDGYYVYTFWASRIKDAIFIRLMVDL